MFFIGQQSVLVSSRTACWGSQMFISTIIVTSLFLLRFHVAVLVSIFGTLSCPCDLSFLPPGARIHLIFSSPSSILVDLAVGCMLYGVPHHENKCPENLCYPIYSSRVYCCTCLFGKVPKYIFWENHISR